MLVLVDTSIWIDHLRKRSDVLVELLEAQHAITHPFVIGELACGNLANRAKFLNALGLLPQIHTVAHQKVLSFVESSKLPGRGLGWIDMHLLASAHFSSCSLWTKDKRLAEAADDVGVRANIGA